MSDFRLKCYGNLFVYYCHVLMDEAYMVSLRTVVVNVQPRVAVLVLT